MKNFEQIKKYAFCSVVYTTYVQPFFHTQVFNILAA